MHCTHALALAHLPLAGSTKQAQQGCWNSRASLPSHTHRHTHAHTPYKYRQGCTLMRTHIHTHLIPLPPLVCKLLLEDAAGALRRKSSTAAAAGRECTHGPGCRLGGQSRGSGGV